MSSGGGGIKGCSTGAGSGTVIAASGAGASAVTSGAGGVDGVADGGGGGGATAAGTMPALFIVKPRPEGITVQVTDCASTRHVYGPRTAGWP
jgi:hypothetical protein